MKANTYKYTIPLTEVIAACNIKPGDHANDAEKFDRNCSAASSIKQNSTDYWDLSCGYDRACEYLKTGWSSYNKSIDVSIANLDIATNRSDIDYMFNTCGDELDVSRFLAGDPNHFLDPIITTTAGSSPIVTIAVNICLSCSVAAETVERRGAAVISLIDALESAGKSVAVNVVSCSADVDKKHQLEITIPIKQPYEYLQKSRLIFSMVHPAMFRRLMFRLYEQLPQSEQKIFRVRSGYGYPANLLNPKDLGIDIYIPSISSGDAYLYQDTKETKHWIKQHLKTVGIELRN